MLTAVLGITTAIGYLAVWIFYAERDDNVSMPQMVYMNFGFLLWLAVATTALCFVLARRAARVTALMDVRQRLVSEAAEADDRHNRELAEHLHDGPLQILLAARLELDEVRERHPDPALDVVHTALHETAAGLRSTVTELHPQVLAQLGLTPAIRELLRQYRNSRRLCDRGRTRRRRQAVVAVLAVPRGAGTARQHSQACPGDRRQGRAVPQGRPHRPADHRRRHRFRSRRSSTAASPKGISGWHPCWSAFDAMGGSMDISSEVGFGTQVTVTSPPEPSPPAPAKQTIEVRPLFSTAFRVPSRLFAL